MTRYRLEVIEIGDERDRSLGAVEGSAELVASLAATVIESAIGDELDEPVAAVAATGTADAEPTKPKRTRRTKAQIAADKEREIAEQRVAGGAPVTQQLDAPAESAPAASSGPAPADAAPATAPVASGETKAPYDPFA